jgi:hypothetical protein
MTSAKGYRARVKLVKRTVHAFFFASGLLFAACGGNNAPGPMPDLLPFIPPDLATKMCISSCTQHVQCQTSCAPAPAGQNCCDTATHTCYVVATAQCPLPPQPDMAMIGPY